MGLRAFGLGMLSAYLPAERVLSLSYPDLLVSQAMLEQIWGVRTFAERDFGKWHGLQHPIPETAEAFARKGTKEFRCVDAVPSRGIEEVCDLNEPQDFGQYDLVIDAGTTEHCANFWQATVNAANAVKVGGIIFHTPPLTMINHGFVCPQPTFYYDTYTQNGWALEKMVLSNGEKWCDSPRINRFNMDPDYSIYVIARRLTDAPMKCPTQSKYLNNPKLA